MVLFINLFILTVGSALPAIFLGKRKKKKKMQVKYFFWGQQQQKKKEREYVQAIKAWKRVNLFPLFKQY